MCAWRCVAIVNRTRRIDPKTFGLFRKIGKDSNGSVSWNTQPNCRASPKKSHFTSVTILFRFFAGLTFRLPVCKRALVTEITSRFRLKELTFGRMPTITNWFGADTFQVISARLSSELRRWTPASEVLFPWCTSTSLCWWFRGGAVLVSVLHAFPHRAGNYAVVSSLTLPFFLSIDSIFLVLFQHRVDPCDS